MIKTLIYRNNLLLLEHELWDMIGSDSIFELIKSFTSACRVVEIILAVTHNFVDKIHKTETNTNNCSKQGIKPILIY